jgi:hypothetical protein
MSMQRLVLDPSTAMVDRRRDRTVIAAAHRLGARVRVLSLGAPIDGGTLHLEGRFPEVGTIVDRSDQPYCWVVSFLVEFQFDPETNLSHVRGVCFNVNVHDLDFVMEGEDEGDSAVDVLEYID